VSSIYFAFAVDGISIANHKHNPGGAASLPWDQTGRDRRSQTNTTYFEGGSFAGKTTNKIRFFPQAPSIQDLVRAVRHFSGEMLRP
jgi:hypothetical protein